MNTDQTTTLGIDLGSRHVKLCLMRDGAIEKTAVHDTIKFYREYDYVSEDGFTIDVHALGFEGAERVVATGYGRMGAALTGAENISELTAHFRGACHQSGLGTFTLLDLGGQDYKVISARDGRMTDMATNDKCAASTGRYLENMARVLDISLDELGTYSDDPAPLSSTCAIFGESELIGLIVRGEPVPRLAAGVNHTIAERVLPHLERMQTDPILLSGGVALSGAVVRILSDLTGREIQVLPEPLLNGAIGCCV